MQASGAVRLGTRSTCMCHCAAAVRQFLLDAGALQEQALASGREERLREVQQFR